MTENVRIINHASGMSIPDCSKSAINRKNNNDVIISWNDVVIKRFWHYCVSLVKFSYWFKFHVNIIIDSGVFFNYLTIFVYKRLIRNPKIGNTLVRISSNIWWLRMLGIPNLVGMSTMKSYWILQNARFITFTVSESLR